MMKENSASYTAQIMALCRAMETRRPGSRLFTDDYAQLFLSGRLRLAARIAAYGAGERFLYRYMQQRIPGALASGIARTRYIDDLLETRLRQGVRQVIVLGAGFDTRALRLPLMQGIHVLEVDHPDTAERKQRLLRKGLSYRPAHVSYLSIDFNRQTLEELFHERGIVITQPTVILWEGVTNYLQREAVDGIMRLVGRFPVGSAIIFTYIHRDVLEHPGSWYGAEKLIAELGEIEEQWTCGFLPEELPGWLKGFGLRLVEDLGAAEYRQRYMPERTVLHKGYEFYRVAMAEVAG
jgi:methyltransferase (TIGR00027 family)